MKYEEIIDHLVSEKIDYNEYKEIADHIEDEEVKKMFLFIAEQEHDHYKMLKELLERKIEN